MADDGRRVANPLALAVLAYLTQRPMHPYELGRTLKSNGDARSIKYRHGSLYMVFAQLAREELIRPVESGRHGGRPERTVYALTDAGREELGSWLRDLLARPRHEFPQIVTALSLLGALTPDDVLAQLDRRLRGLDAQRHEIDAVIAEARGVGVHDLYLVEEEYRLEVLAAETEFFRRLHRRLADPATGWRNAWTGHREDGDLRPDSEVTR